MNKKLIVFALGFLWLVVAIGVVMSKQYILRTGLPVVLETVPVDPRDFLRGDYVILSYKISALDLNQIVSKKTDYRRGEDIFVELTQRGKFWEAVAIHEKRDITKGMVCIKGRVKYCYSKRLSLIYGIESYFVPEGEGRELERSMRGNKSSVSVEAVVDSSGNAMIKRVYIDKAE